MHFLSDELDEYASKHTEKEPDFLQKLNRDTHLKVLQPRMLSGHFQGRLLSMLSHLVQPKRVLEIGTYTGYSALCMAEGLQEEGKIITIDCNEDLSHFIEETIANSDYAEQIQFICGDAMTIVPELNETFDLVFIDADKSNYIHYYEMVLPKVRAGGLIIADNVLWSGKVLDTDANQDADTQVLAKFNALVQEDERVQNVLLPVRDGLMVLRKV
jgi:caffeoyl-CoA O-methyltransferase